MEVVMMGGNVSDGRRDREKGFTLIEVLIVLVVISLIAGIAIQTALFAFDVARLGKSVANMRQITSAIMQYETANSAVPGGGLQPVSAIMATLGTQAGRLNPKDGWGHDLYYESLAGGGATDFRVYCYGKDGVPDGGVTGSWVDFFTDTVIENGMFIQTKW
jgi:general secretion pathway protein G